jgi:myosin regulatory light chain 12
MKQLKTMLEECPGQMNFTHFLTLFGEKLHGKGGW